MYPNNIIRLLNYVHGVNLVTDRIVFMTCDIFKQIMRNIIILFKRLFTKIYLQRRWDPFLLIKSTLIKTFVLLSGFKIVNMFTNFIWIVGFSDRTGKRLCIPLHFGFLDVFRDMNHQKGVLVYDTFYSGYESTPLSYPKPKVY